MKAARKPFGVITRKAVTRILGAADMLPERSKSSRVLTTVACRLQLFVYELEHARFEHRALPVEQLLDRLQEHCQLLSVAGVQGGGVQSGYALLSELSNLLKELQASVLLLPGDLGSDDRYKPALDELQALLINVSHYRQECEDTKRHLEAALSELAQAGRALPTQTDIQPTSLSAAGKSSPMPSSSATVSAAAAIPPAAELSPRPSSKGNSSSPMGATAVDINGRALDTSEPGDMAVLQRVRQMICSLELDVEMKEQEQDLDAELIQLRDHLQLELLQQEQKDIQRQQHQQQAQLLDLDDLAASQLDGARQRAWDNSCVPGQRQGCLGSAVAPVSREDGATITCRPESPSSLSWNSLSLSQSGSWSAGPVPFGAAAEAATTIGRTSRLHAARHISRRLAAQHLALLKDHQRQLRLQQAAAAAASYDMSRRGRREGSDGDSDVPPATRRRIVPARTAAAAFGGEQPGAGPPFGPVVAFGKQLPTSPIGASPDDSISAMHVGLGRQQSNRECRAGEPSGAPFPFRSLSAEGPDGEGARELGECCISDPSFNDAESSSDEETRAGNGAATTKGLTVERGGGTVSPVVTCKADLDGRVAARCSGDAEAWRVVLPGLLASPSPSASPPHRPTAARVAALRKMNRVTTLAGMWEAGKPVAADADSAVATTVNNDCEDASDCDSVELPVRPAPRKGLAAPPPSPGQAVRDVPPVSHSPFLMLAMQGRAPKVSPPPVLGRLLVPPPGAEAIEEEVPAAPHAITIGTCADDTQKGSPVNSPTAVAAAGMAAPGGWGMRARGAVMPGATAAPAPLPLPDASVHLRAVGLPGCHPPPHWSPPGPFRLPAAAAAAARMWPHDDAGGAVGDAPAYGVDGGGDGSSGNDGGGSGLLDFGPDVPTVNLQRDITCWGPCLGRGAFGAVYKALFRNKPAAVKVLHGGALDLRDLRSLRTEISLLCRLRHHPNIITVFGAAAAPPDQVALVTELMDCDLYDYIHRRRQNCVPLDEVLIIARAIASGLSELHPAIVHRDLKPANVLLRHSAPPPQPHNPQLQQQALTQDRRLTVKIADFGLARHKRSQYLSTRETDAGTLKYMAPECIAHGGGSESDVGPGEGGGVWGGGGGITEKCDIYSFGVLLYELITGREPWEGCHPLYAMCQVQSGVTLQLPDDPSRCPPDLRSLVLRCWAYQHHQRPSSKELLMELDDIIAGQQLRLPAGEQFACSVVAAAEVHCGAVPRQ